MLATLLACGGSSDSTGPGGNGNGSAAQIVITPNAPSITEGAQTTLQAEVRGSNGQVIAGATVFWSSADTNVVTVSSIGVVTGKIPGSVQVAASSGGASAVITVTVVQAPVASVAVLPSAATLVIGGTTTLQAVAYDAGSHALSGRSIVWASSAPQVATVDASGKVTGVTAGTATATGTVDGKTASSTITITVIPVAAVAVVPGSAGLDVGASKSFVAVATDANGNTLTGRPIKWTSADATIATVSTAGLVTGVGAGTTNISATAEGKTGVAQVVVTATTPPPPIPVASVAVTPGTQSLNIGGTVTLSATVRDSSGGALSGRAITWSTGDPTVATVSSTGVVTAKAPGAVAITATSEGKSGSATITVLPAAPPSVASITINPNGTTIDSAQATTLVATVLDSAGNALSGRPVTWSTSSSQIATVSQSGVVTGGTPGAASITARSDTATASVIVTVHPVPVASVAVTAANSIIQVGATTTMTAVTKAAGNYVLLGRTVTWSSSDPTTASVDASGLVKGLAVGTATITGTSEGKTGTATITVIPIPVASVTIAPTSASVVEHLTTTFTATTKDANGNVLTGRLVTWSSSATSVAAIDVNGVVTGVAAGPAATITATSEGKSGTATVTVTQAPVATVTLAPPGASLIVGQTQTFTATTKDAPGFVLTGRAIIWTSNKPATASVNQTTGLVTALDSGVAMITATSETIGGSATVTVSLVPVAAVSVTSSRPSPMIGQTAQLTANPTDASGNALTGRAVTWTSTDPALATVAGNGLVTVLNSGSVTIDALVDGVTGSITFLIP